MSATSMKDRIQEAYNTKYTFEQTTVQPFQIEIKRPSTTRYDEAVRLMRGTKGKCLELASNNGAFTMAIAEQYSEIVGIDISSTAIEVAQQSVNQYCPQHAHKIKFMVGSAEERLPFKDGEFDAVYAIALLEHLMFIYDALDEWGRVTKPGGHLLLCVPNAAYVKHVVDLVRDRLPLTGTHTRDVAYCRVHGWDGHHLHYFTKSSLTSLLDNCGWVAEEWTSDGKWAKYRRFYHNFVGNLIVRARRKG